MTGDCLPVILMNWCARGDLSHEQNLGVVGAEMTALNGTTVGLGRSMYFFGARFPHSRTITDHQQFVTG